MAYTLIKDIIAPNLGKKESGRLLIAINQADMAMKGRHWNHKTNEPDEELLKFLEEKAESTRQRIKKDTGLDIEPIFYSAGYKEGGDSQKPYNLSKLLAYILEKIPSKKRISVALDVNQDQENFQRNDKKTNYQEVINDTINKSWFDILRDSTKTIFNSITETTKEYLSSNDFKKLIKQSGNILTDILVNVFSKIKK